MPLPVVLRSLSFVFKPSFRAKFLVTCFERTSITTIVILYLFNSIFVYIVPGRLILVYSGERYEDRVCHRDQEA